MLNSKVFDAVSRPCVCRKSLSDRAFFGPSPETVQRAIEGRSSLRWSEKSFLVLGSTNISLLTERIRRRYRLTNRWLIRAGNFAYPLTLFVHKLGVEPSFRHVAPYREPFPIAELCIMTLDLFVRADFFLVVFFIELRTQP